MSPTTPHKITLSEANARIADLRRSTVPPRAEPEDLDRGPDPAIRVVGDPGNRRLELMDGDTAASWTHVIEFEQQVGDRTLRMGGIGGVGTHADYRFQGLSRRVMESALAWMRGEGYDVTMLYGIPAFYPKFGYVCAFPDVRATLSLRDIEHVQNTGLEIVDFDLERHGAAVLEMYHALNAGRTGPVRRRAGANPFRKGLHWNTSAQGRVVVDSAGRPVGYVVRHVQHLSAIYMEVGWKTPEVAGDLLHEMARHAIMMRVGEIHLALPEDHPFVRRFEPMGLTKTIHYRVDNEAMVRLINIPRALEKLAPLLSDRMGRAPGRLNLRTNLDDVGLEWDAEGLRVGAPIDAAPDARLPQWALAQMLYGYRDATSHANDGVLAAPHEAIELLDRMFPVHPHFHYAADMF